MQVSRFDWFMSGFSMACMLVVLAFVTVYFCNKAHYKNVDEEVTYYIKDAWRSDAKNIYMAQVHEMNAKAKVIMDSMTNNGFKVTHIGNTAFGGRPYKSVTFRK